MTYKDGVFTLTGQSSSASEMSSVEISALVNDGARQTLGVATVDANGTFTFDDAIGASQQSFFEATPTGEADAQAAGGDPGFSLTGGLGPRGRGAEQDSYNSGVLGSMARFRPDGRRLVNLTAPGQTIDLQPYDIVFNHHQADTTFVFEPGFGLEVIKGLTASEPNHDVLDLPSSDFHGIADVLRNTGDIQGSAWITDPKTGDAIRLAGVTTAELRAHPKDITFHA